MKPDKALNETQPSTNSSTEKATQTGTQQHSTPQAELHESPKNLLKSYHTLRKFDEELAEKQPQNTAKKE